MMMMKQHGFSNNMATGKMMMKSNATPVTTFLTRNRRCMVSTHYLSKSRNDHIRCISSSSSSWSSSSSSKDGTGGNVEDLEKMVLCDVIQGPSLLRTPHARPHPSLLFLPGLRSLPFWTNSDSTRVAYNDPTVQYVIQLLEENVDEIRKEYLTVAPNIPSDYHPQQQDMMKTKPTDTGGNGSSVMDPQHASLHQGNTPWKWHSYLTKGHVQGPFVQSFPYTSKILQQLRNDGILFEGTPFGFAFFSTLGPQSKIAPHTAPMNLRLRIHLPLIVPKKKNGDDDNNTNDNGDDDKNKKSLLGIRVGFQEREWILDKAIVFDDSYEHEVWNDHESESRVLLLVDIWHPDITLEEKTSIIQLFQQARLDGLWKR